MFKKEKFSQKIINKRKKRLKKVFFFSSSIIIQKVKFYEIAG